MNVNEAWAKIKTNRMVLIMNYIICGALATGYFADFLKGRKTAAFVALFFMVMVVELCAASIAYRRSRASDGIKFYSMAGYMLIYCFAMFSSDTYFTFVYIFPMTVLYILYYNAGFIKTVGIVAVITNAAKIIYQIYSGNTSDTDITSYMVQMACVTVYSIGMYFITKLSVDINNEKIAEIMEINKSLDEANKSKTNFLASMSHEIRTPMNAIIGIAQIQLQKENLSEEQESALEKIYNSGSTLLGIINDILDMSKIETGKMELNPIDYDVPSLINDAVQLNIVRIGPKPIEFILDIDETLPSRMFGDELRLKQILNNLLSNAIKYTDKGYVKLSVRHLVRGEETLLCLTVEDSGQGMKPEDQEKLFSEYLRFNAKANRATEGTGIGLNITRNLIRMMDGTIEVESEYDRGSKFMVQVRQEMVPCDVIGPELSERLRNFSFSEKRQLTKLNLLRVAMPYGKVLVVDDVETNLYVAEGLMSPYGLTIESVTSGFAAIHKVESGESYDVIFMDHMMPLMDGIETVQKLRDMGYGGVIVALTANALVGNDVMFKENGSDDFIAKPIDIRQLNAILNRFVRDRHPAEAAKYQAEYKTMTAGGAKNPSESQAEPPAATENVENLINPKLLEVFCRDAEKAVTTLRNTSAESDSKLFTTTVHAMKSALANIGERDASAKAFELENAGRNEDMDFISANLESFLFTLEALINQINLSETIATVDRPDINEDIAFLQAELLRVRTACEEYDDTAAYAALDLLKEQPWTAETLAALESIRDMLFLHSDFDGAAESVSEFLNTIQ